MNTELINGAITKLEQALAVSETNLTVAQGLVLSAAKDLIDSTGLALTAGPDDIIESGS